MNIVENESTATLRSYNVETEESLSDEDAEENHFLTSKGKSMRTGYYSSKLFYLEFKMKAILSINS